MDIALVLDRLVPNANYSGSVSSNNEAAYNAIAWNDQAAKPSWQAILDEWDVYAAEQAAKKEYLIYGLLAANSPFMETDKTRLPVDIDFKTGLNVNLYKEVVMDGGAPVYKQYYLNATLNQDGSITYANPVVKIVYEFDRDSISLARSCTQKFYWYDVEGNISTSYKEIKDFYNTSEQMAEAEQRRTNIISDLKVKTIGLLMLTESITQEAAAELGRPFLAEYKNEIYNYIDEANTGFATAVTNASAVTYPWLENQTPYAMTIREFILDAVA